MSMVLRNAVVPRDLGLIDTMLQFDTITFVPKFSLTRAHLKVKGYRDRLVKQDTERRWSIKVNDGEIIIWRWK